MNSVQKSGFSAPYKKMYLCLFNAITDALQELEKRNASSARKILQEAQRHTEECIWAIDPPGAYPSR